MSALMPVRPANTGSLTPKGADAPSLVPWLASWKPSDTLPAKAKGEVEAALPALQHALVPSTAKQFAVAMDGFVDWLEAFGVSALPPPGPEREARLGKIVGLLREDLADLPPDLLVEALRRTRRNHRFRTIPLPADIRDQVKDEWSRRKARLSAAQACARFGQFESTPLAAEDRVRPDQLRKLREELAAGAAAREMEGADTPEDGEPPPPPNARQDQGAHR